MILLSPSLGCRLIIYIMFPMNGNGRKFAISNLYQPVQEGRLPAACHIFETFQLLPHGAPICVGDNGSP